ncbi:unnamed protein product, partial [Mesorhabditis belari]|uniref:Metallo-beta-lactamase domain-containing protein n=1 Tax=Mesorhabditis belari TaxID=2138241 RepID=A0AAF3FN91_9BILA
MTQWLFLLFWIGICLSTANASKQDPTTTMDTDDFAKPDIEGGRYKNPSSFANWDGIPGPSSLIKWRLTEKDESKIPSDEKELNKTIPVIPMKSFESNSSLFASWLGHATVLASVDGVKLITDPVWAQRVSPFPFAGPRRYRPPPIDIENLPELDIGVISHDHYDHLDIDAVKKINSRFPSMRWFVPMGMGDWLKSQGIESDATNRERVTQMSWGQSKEVTISGKNFTVWCIPAQHWCQRGPFDRNKRLWAGWIVEGPTKKFLYTGDTGFCNSEYEKVGKKFGGIDLAAIPIGCYAPRWFMKSQHIDVPEAISIHKLIKAKTSIGIHWGTYEMGSYEFYLDPKQWLERELKKESGGDTKFITIPMGSIWEDKPNPSTKSSE